MFSVRHLFLYCSLLFSVVLVKECHFSLLSGPPISVKVMNLTTVVKEYECDEVSDDALVYAQFDTRAFKYYEQWNSPGQFGMRFLADGTILSLMDIDLILMAGQKQQDFKRVTLNITQ
jgi:hypothetical protein